MSSSSPVTGRISGGSLQLEDKHAHSFPLRSEPDNMLSKELQGTCNHKTRAGKDRVSNRKTPKAKKRTLVPSLSPEAGMLCSAKPTAELFSSANQKIPFSLCWDQFGLGFLPHEIQKGSELDSQYWGCMHYAPELKDGFSGPNSSLSMPSAAAAFTQYAPRPPAGSFLHPLRFIQPQWCGQHTPFSLSVSGHTGQRISILLSGPTLAHVWGPLPEMTLLLCLPLLQMTEGCFVFVLFFKFSRRFSVPLMPFFKSSWFLKDLLYQGTSHLFSLSGFCFYLSEEN